MKKTNIIVMFVLMTAMVFIGCDNGTTSLADTTALDAAIATATTLNNATAVGSAIGNVTQDSKDTFTAAIAAAQAVSDDANSTQEVVDAAIVTLAAATDAFTASIILIVPLEITLPYGILSDTHDGLGDVVGTRAAFSTWSDDNTWTGVMPVVFDTADTSEAFDGTESWSITYDGTAIGGGSFVYLSDTVDEDAKSTADFSAATNLVFSIITDTDNLEVKIESGATSTVLLLSDYTPVSTSGSWDTYEIPCADFAGVDFSAVTVPVGFWNPTGWAPTPYYTGVIYIDNVYFE
ncbi:MAG: FIVAR domain-containing protein [Spirochaetales bacterium]|nr:FIVAR domain-containing protein [Spirochaetales bacterium]